MIKFFRKWAYRYAEEEAAVHGNYREALYWARKGDELNGTP